VRVVPNLYPALDRQEVVIHAPRHVRSFAELTDVEVETVATAWIARAESHGEPPGYVHALVNEGHSAGASLPHSHSQLVWLRGPPPAVRDEHDDALGELLATAVEEGLVVEEAANLVAFCHPVGRLPYETLIMDASLREAWPDEPTLAVALRLLRNTVARLQAIEGTVPWNAWLHHGGRWHIELVPRLSVLAGLELGAGIYVNALLATEAARALQAT
jgi:UDPglucose--hexose-1-phosphate uridylyltransferase